MRTMKAAVFVKPGQIILDEKPIPKAGPGEAVIKVTTTTICGTDVHILKGEYPVKPGLIIGHEPVGVITELGAGVTGYQIGQRDRKSTRLNSSHITIDGCQAEYLLVPDAMANMEPIPDDLTDEQVLMCPDIMSTGFSGAESGRVKIGDTVVVFAQGPIGLCATAGAKLRGATRIITVDGIPERLAISKRMGADITINFREKDPIEEIMKITNGQGVDVAIEALGTQGTFESCLRVLKPGGVLSSLGVYSGGVTVPGDAFAAGLADQAIVTTLCPGGKERMRRLLNVVQSGRVDTQQLVTHRFKLDQIEEAYDLFANARDGVLKIAITTE